MANRLGHRIEKITASSAVTSFAGNGTAGSVDGSALQGSFNEPVGITRDAAGRIYVAESTGRRVRMIDGDMITTAAGNGESGFVDGTVANARFEQPRAIACDRIGNLYISDEQNGLPGKIRKIRPDGTVTTLFGPTFQTGTSTVIYPDSFGVSSPRGLDVDENGVVYIADTGNYTIIKAVQEDWDNDGVPDDIEATLGAPFVVGVDDRLADADGDIMSNHAEWIASSNPLEPTSQPVEVVVTRHADGTVDLLFPCEPGSIQRLEYSDDLLVWKPMGAATSTALRSFSTRLNASPNASQRFYRLRSSL